MSGPAQLSISLATPDHAVHDGYSCVFNVTHLSARVVSLDDGTNGLPFAPGIRLLLTDEESVQLLVDSRSFRLSPGMVLAVGGDAKVVATDAESDEESTPVPEMHVIEFNACVGDSHRIQALLDLPLLLDAESADTLLRVYRELTSGSTPLMPPPGTVDLATHLAALTLAATLIRASAASDAQSAMQHRDDRSGQLRQFLFKNLDRTVTVPQMARHLGMSRASFYRWAAKELGCSPLQYLRTLRLERSLEWIAQDAAPIQQIAVQAGFYDNAHFSRAFKKRFGVTPAKYRRNARLLPGAVSRVRAAEQLFSHGRFDEALAACEQCLTGNPPTHIRDRALYQKGLCLRALGRQKEAIDEWRRLHSSGFSHRARLQECRELFRAGEAHGASQLLWDLYTHSSAVQQESVIHLWMDQTRALVEARQPHALRAHLALRGKLFPQEAHSMRLAVNALRMLGDNMEILEQCAGLTIACFNALRRAGHYDEAVARYGSQVSLKSLVQGALMQGRFEDALAMEPRDPSDAVEALVGVGRAEEAIARYPGHSASAYLALGRYEELLERFPPGPHGDAVRAAAFVALGRAEEFKPDVNDPATSWVWREVQLHTRPAAVLKASYPSARRLTGMARVLAALDLLHAGNRREAEAMLEEVSGIRSRDLWWYDHSTSELLTAAVIRGILGCADELRDDLAEIVANHKFKDKQVFWHDAAFLNGSISVSDYRNQPQPKELPERFLYIQAIADDLAGRGDSARTGYEAIRRTRTPFAPAGLVRHRFAKWRLEEL